MWGKLLVAHPQLNLKKRQHKGVKYSFVNRMWGKLQFAWGFSPIAQTLEILDA